MLEPENNPTASYLVDPPRLLRFLLSKRFSRFANAESRAKKRVAAEKKRKAEGRPHVVEYFHQLDDPYSHLMAQVVARFAASYDIEFVPHLVRATGGRSQPEIEKLSVWARRDCGLIAPHYGLSFPGDAGVVPDPQLQQAANRALTRSGPKGFLNQVESISTQLWSSDSIEKGEVSAEEAEAALETGSARLAELGHYSGAMLYYAGEWYWGVDRLFHLEDRLRELGLCKDPGGPYIAPRPELDVRGTDAGALDLHFFPSLNSPYSAIIYDKTIELSQACKINLHHKPVLPMVMRGVPATPTKAGYIFFDAKRESEFLGVSFGNTVITIGEPTRQAYSLLPWAKSQGKDIELLSTLLRYAFSEGKALYRKNMRRAVEEVGLDWAEALKHLGGEDWKSFIERHQDEMVEGMGLWGVPSYRLSGPDSEPDLEVWGQDRLWLVAAEIRRRVSL